MPSKKTAPKYFTADPYFTRLNDEEIELLKALRRFRVEEARGPRPVPAALLEHGYVSMSRAAKLLSVTPSKLKSMTTHFGTLSLEAPLPVFKSLGIPLSELRVAWEKLEADRFRRAASQVVGLIRTEHVTGWSADRPCYLDPYFKEDIYAYSVEDVAAELRLTLPEAQRLMDAKGRNSLACWKNSRRAKSRVRRAELEAYKRKLGIPGKVDLPIAVREVRARVEAETAKKVA